MAGYYGFSMSNNAVEAYRKGLLPASKISGVPTELIKSLCAPAEWHHTSKHFNATDFYDPDIVMGKFGLLGDEHDFFDHKAVAALKKHRSTKANEVSHVDCRVEWLEWSGTRKNPKCKTRIELGATVTVKASTATICCESGEIVVKRLSTNGFSYEPDYTKTCRTLKKDMLARSRKLPVSLWANEDGEKVWVAVSKNGKRVLAVKHMRFYECDYQDKSSNEPATFTEYRDVCKASLAMLGIVMSGTIRKINERGYFVAEKCFSEAFSDALSRVPGGAI